MNARENVPVSHLHVLLERMARMAFEIKLPQDCEFIPHAGDTVECDELATHVRDQIAPNYPGYHLLLMQMKAIPLREEDHGVQRLSLIYARVSRVELAATHSMINVFPSITNVTFWITTFVHDDKHSANHNVRVSLTTPPPKNEIAYTSLLTGITIAHEVTFESSHVLTFPIPEPVPVPATTSESV